MEIFLKKWLQKQEFSQFVEMEQSFVMKQSSQQILGLTRLVFPQARKASAWLDKTLISKLFVFFSQEMASETRVFSIC
jgi:hypothetical protein